MLLGEGGNLLINNKEGEDYMSTYSGTVIKPYWGFEIGEKIYIKESHLTFEWCANIYRSENMRMDSFVVTTWDKEMLNECVRIESEENQMNELDIFAMRKEREKGKRERWTNFEHKLRYLLCDLKDETDREDSFLLDDIKQSILVFVMKDQYGEENKIFLDNMKNDFYNVMKKLEEKHPDIKSRTFYIKLFMEDFYFNE